MGRSESSKQRRTHEFPARQSAVQLGFGIAVSQIYRILLFNAIWVSVRPSVPRNQANRNFPIDYREQIGNIEGDGVACMLVLDPSMLLAIAALVSSLSAFVWAVRRKP